MVDAWTTFGFENVRVLKKAKPEPGLGSLSTLYIAEKIIFDWT